MELISDQMLSAGEVALCMESVAIDTWVWQPRCARALGNECLHACGKVVFHAVNIIIAINGAP